MSQDELLQIHDNCLLKLLAFHQQVSLLVQRIPGDETSRKLRHAYDQAGKALSVFDSVGAQIREIGRWDCD
jgi:hypothetical protein